METFALILKIYGYLVCSAMLLTILGAVIKNAVQGTLGMGWQEHLVLWLAWTGVLAIWLIVLLDDLGTFK